MTPRAQGEVGLPDGRSLAFAEWGSPDGAPVLLFHGAPGSRLLCPDVGATLEHGVRLVVADRPGYGRSDPSPGRTAVDWVEDVTALADSLDFDRFAVVGWSAGGVHALACAARIPERLSAVGIISAGCPPEEAEIVLDAVDGMRTVYEGAQDDRVGTEQLLAAFFQGYADDPNSLYEQARSATPDDAVWGEPAWDESFRVHTAEGLRPGVAGYASDLVVGCLPGFRLSEVRVPVLAWFGEKDAPLALASAAPLEANLASCTMRRWDGLGHGGLYPRWGEVLSSLTEPTGRRRAGAS